MSAYIENESKIYDQVEQSLPDLAHTLDDLHAGVDHLGDHTSFDYSQLFGQVNTLIEDVNETVHKVVDTVGEYQEEGSLPVHQSAQHQSGAMENQSGSAPSQVTTLPSLSFVVDQTSFGTTTSHAGLDLSDLGDHTSFDFSQLFDQVNTLVDNVNETVHEVVDQRQAELSALVHQIEEQRPDWIGDSGASGGDFAHLYDLLS
jgi:uncharacterized protein YoxC